MLSHFFQKPDLSARAFSDDTSLADTPRRSLKHSGFIDIPIDRCPLGALRGIPTYRLSSIRDKKGQLKESYTLYSASHYPFTPELRQRLLDLNVQHVYIPSSLHPRFKQQQLEQIEEIVTDPDLSGKVKSDIAYESALETINDLLSHRNLPANLPRIERISRAITTLVLKGRRCFDHLLTASHHTFYLASHTVNVATSMVSLAYEMGCRERSDLVTICQAGLLHDVGQMFVPAEILLQKTPLTDDQWQLIKTHAFRGYEYLRSQPDVPSLVCLVARQHHERPDGAGYPDGLCADRIHPLSRICSVVDSFDAMTCYRPYRSGVMSAEQALVALNDRTPDRYDTATVQAFTRLHQRTTDAPEEVTSDFSITPESAAAASAGAGATAGTAAAISMPSIQIRPLETNRLFPRFPIQCPAEITLLTQDPSGNWQQSISVPATAHSLSQSGLAIHTELPLRIGQRVRVHLTGPGALQRTEDALIVRCRPQSDATYDIGLHFAPLTPMLQERAG